MVENEGTTNTNIKLMLLAASYDQTNLTKKEINKPTNCFTCISSHWRSFQQKTESSINVSSLISIRHNQTQEKKNKNKNRTIYIQGDINPELFCSLQ
jgi:hypothetical protein